jgi:hypothetical protein
MKCTGCEYLNLKNSNIFICLHPFARGTEKHSDGKGYVVCTSEDKYDVEQPVWCPIVDEGDVYD